MKVRIGLLVLFFLICGVTASSGALPDHPRLILTESRLTEVLGFISNSTEAAGYVQELTAHGEYFLNVPPVVRPPPGPSGILSAARAVLQRIYTFATLFRITRNTTWSDRCIKEMLNRTQWSDWNTEQHALDTGELAHGVAIGFDWLYDVLTPEQKSIILSGMVKNAFEPFYTAYTEHPSWSWWQNSPINWNQVVNGGAIVASLAVMDEPEIPSYVRDVVFPSALSLIKISVDEYSPDGSWWEGIGYHGYASDYFAAAASSLLTTEPANVTDLLEISGVNELDRFPLFSVSNRLQAFDWADCDSGTTSDSHLLFYANYFEDKAVAYWTRALANLHLVPVDDDSSASLLYPQALIYFTPIGSAADVEALPLDMAYIPRHLVLIRSSWSDPNGTFIGLKGGNNTWNHNHLDAGTFVYETQGVRFAEDLGADNYALPGYFGSQRWDYYRLNTRGHNTLMFGNQIQDPSEAADIVLFNSTVEDSLMNGQNDANTWAVIDLSRMYAKDGVHSALRGFAALNGRSQLLIVDEIDTSGHENVTWALHTVTDVHIASNTRATLSSGGVAVDLVVLPDSSCPGAKLTATEVRLSPPQYPTDGLTRIDFSSPDASTCTRIAILIGKGIDSDLRVNPLARWGSEGPLASG